MGIFTKKLQPLAPLPDRAKAARTAIFDALRDNHLTGNQAISVLNGLLQDQQRVAACAPLETTRPRTTVIEPPTSRLAKLLGRA